jgi:hypothetical protein
MIIYVTTPKQLARAFEDWIGEDPSDERRIIETVFEAFMATPEAASLHTVSGLVCFPVESWELKFRRWVETEVERAPASEENCIFCPNPITDSGLNRSPILEHSDH